MEHNPIIDTMLARKSLRSYTDRVPSDDVVHTVVRAGQSAPFVAQMCSLLLCRDSEKHPWRAPLLFTICVDAHRMETIMARRGWRMVTNDLSLLLFSIQDAALVAENMVLAAESLGMGTCFLGGAPYRAKEIAKEYNLPKRVFPLVQMTMGYPAEDLSPRPRYPIDFALFEGKYPSFTDEQIERAMKEMDDGYLAQDYYRRLGAMIRLEGDREETFDYDSYSWTEHISRKWGQWYASPDALLEQMEFCGFHVADIGDACSG
jgi:FMN reductase [NAD(P)H]